MQTSTNFGFKLPQGSDPVSIADLNYNWSWLDSNLVTIIHNNTESITLDTTLTQQGNAADAKAAGDAIALKLNVIAGTTHAGKMLYIDQLGRINYKNYAANDFLMSGYTEPAAATSRIPAISASDDIVTAIQYIVARLKALENA